MINWSITPAVYNESFTYMEMLGKLIYYADNHEVRIDELEKDIVDVKAKIEEHEEAITALQTWKTDVIEPFRTYTLSSLDILDERTDDLTTAVGLINNNIDEIEDNLTSEIATRANADTSLSQEIAQVKVIAKDAAAKANRIDIQIENSGTIRYFLITNIDQETDEVSTTITFEMPDNEWDAVDVRGHYETTEFRVCGLNSGDMVETGIYTLLYNSTSKEMVLTVSDVVELDRLDFILYKNALTEEEEEQRDIDFYNAMDSDGDGVVDASDASNVLAFYSTFQTGGLPDIYTSPNKEAWIYYCENIATNLDADSFPDFDGDGKSDASDASQILAYYSYRQTHTFEEGMTEPEIMRIYRTTVLELNLD